MNSPAPLKPQSQAPQKKRFDKKFLSLIIVAELVLFAVAFFMIGDKEEDTAPRRPASIEEEAQAMKDIETVAKKKSWEGLEATRTKILEGFIVTETAPSRGTALYFFPETLPKHSFERDFAEQELKPELQALREAFQTGKPKEAEKAYGSLKSRVENYELGASSDESDLSYEAEKFLGVYRNFQEPSKKGQSESR